MLLVGGERVMTEACTGNNSEIANYHPDLAPYLSPYTGLQPAQVGLSGGISKDTRYMEPGSPYRGKTPIPYK